MNWSVFDYAGNTALAWTAWLTSLVVLLAILGCSAWLLWRRRWLWGSYPLALLVVWGILWGVFGSRLDHAWLYLQENALRRHSTYVALTFATAFLPTSGDTGRGALMHVATRDFGFAKGKPKTVEKREGHLIATYEDEDYPGGVVTFDGRPVDTGFRFRSTRMLVSLIPYVEMPTAKSAWVLGDEAWLYAKPLAESGLKLLGDKDDAPVDLLLVAPGPDWQVGADTPSVADWQRLAKRLSKGGVAALHINARMMSRSRFKALLADFRATFVHYHLWCTGRYDYVLTSGRNVLADEVAELFDRPQAYGVLAAADAVSPAEIFASYVGTDFEVDPVFFEVPAQSRSAMVWTAPRLAFSPPPTNHLALVKPGIVTTYFVPNMGWIKPGLLDKAVFKSLTNGMFKAQAARREALLGFDDADRGASTNAIERWSSAAKVNPRDPLLRSLADSLDLEGRRYLRIGNVNGAIRCYENRLLIRPEDVAAVHNFGVCLKKSGHHDMAASVFAKAVTMDPQTDEHRLELVECCAASHKEDIACRQLDVLMKRHPTDPSLKMRAARLLCLRSNKVRDETRAIELAEEAVRLTAWKDRAYVQSLADVYIDSGRTLMGLGLKKKMKEMRFDK